tara:strand:- start:3068 stop:4222 length:1155 start_codon:yes stop_codon:yes gene_type:complete
VDFYSTYANLTDEQNLIMRSTRDWVNQVIRPDINKYFQEGVVHPEAFMGLAEIGAFGLIIPEKYGGCGMDFVSFGLMMQELERCDSSIRVVSSIQTSLVMYAIHEFGSEAQKEYYLPRLASGELMGAFGLTEPDFGSNPSGMICRFDVSNEHILLQGSKMWIGNSENADLSIVWAKNSENEVCGIIIEKGKVSNFTSNTFQDKWSFRSSKTGELIFNESKVPIQNLLPNTKGIQSAYKCLNIGRFAVAWGSLGIAMECFDTALKYSQERLQFGKPIGSKQLIQKKLASMATEITKAQLLCMQLARLMDQGESHYAQVSMAKRNNVKMAQAVAMESRQILGGMGISTEYPIMRHMINLETLITYQGTNEIHELIIGRELTGFDAF